MRDNRTRDFIVEAADQLFYQQGYERTSFSDIADAVKISRGNFYYHFKSKDQILEAVISTRLTETRRMLEQWESEGQEPADRIRSFIRILVANQTKIMRYGCPVGALCTELAKLNHASKHQANKLFTLFRTWLRRQFTLLGCEANADELAMHVLVWSQGVAVLANTFHDEKFIHREVAQMCEWLNRCAENVASREHQVRSKSPINRKANVFRST